MSCKTATQDKPKGRGGKREGAGPKAKYILPHETGVEMTTLSVRIRTDSAEQIHDGAEALGISQAEYVMRKCTPKLMAMLDAWRASQIE